MHWIQNSILIVGRARSRQNVGKKKLKSICIRFFQYSFFVVVVFFCTSEPVCSFNWTTPELTINIDDWFYSRNLQFHCCFANTCYYYILHWGKQEYRVMMWLTAELITNGHDGRLCASVDYGLVDNQFYHTIYICDSRRISHTTYVLHLYVIWQCSDFSPS